MLGKDAGAVSQSWGQHTGAILVSLGGAGALQAHSCSRIQSGLAARAVLAQLLVPGACNNYDQGY